MYRMPDKSVEVIGEDSSSLVSKTDRERLSEALRTIQLMTVELNPGPVGLLVCHLLFETRIIS